MFGRTLLNVARRSRKFFEGFLERAGVISKESKPVNVVRCESSQQQAHHARGYILQRLAKYGRHNLATQLRHQFSKSPVYREYKGLANKLSMYAFVGLGYASGSSRSESETESQDFTSICEDIKKRFNAKNFEVTEDPFQNLTEHGLENYQLGSMIAKGCNAAVYRAKYMACGIPMVSQEAGDGDDVQHDAFNENISEDLTDIDSDLEVIEDEFPPEIFCVADNVDQKIPDEMISLESDDQSDIEVIDELELNGTGEITMDILYQQQVYDDAEPSQMSTGRELGTNSDLDLAIKIMFNYDIESNASELYKHLKKELLPAHIENVDELFTLWHNGHRAKDKPALPSHPNIVTMYGGFVDDFPVALPEAREQFPCALPQSANPDGCGRNKTLFLVMKRYPYTLREYLQVRNDLSVHQSVLLLLQLVEAVIHMTDHGVAHRDLKSDNIFVEEIEGCPRLVVSDFGESVYVASEQELCVPYLTGETSKGGNDALRAPEIACAKPEPNGVLDYRKSDLWAVGALAYEIFGFNNPFYRLDDGTRLRSATYREDDLPVLDGLPSTLQKLIRNMLSRDPKQRLNARQVSACLHVLLWSPDEWTMNLNSDDRLKFSTPSELDLIRWLLLSTAQVLLEPLLHINRLEHELKVLFLSHLDFEELVESVHFL